MPAKRTFTRRTMAFAPSDDSASVSKANTNKRRKPSPPESSSPLPHSHSSAVARDNDTLSREPKQATRQSRATRNGHNSKFSGPISIPDDQMTGGKASNTKDLFEAGLQNANKNAPKAQQPNSTIYGGRDEFDTFMRNRREKKTLTSTHPPHNQAGSPTDDKNTSSDDGLEIVDMFKHNGARDDEAATHEADEDVNAIQNSLRGGGRSAVDVSARIFEGREYMSSPTPAPRKSLREDRLSKRSRLARL